MKKLIITITLLCVTVLNAQDNNVATIGDIKISAKEFLERYELSPVIGKENIRNEIGANIHFCIIIAEKFGHWKPKSINI
jgi:hypothetical protein